MKTQDYEKKYRSKCSNEYEKATQNMSNLAEVLKQIDIHYKSFSKKCEDGAKRLLSDILDEKELNFIHSARYRVKTNDSLLIKFIKKQAKLSVFQPQAPDLATEIEKYRNCNENDYYKVFTDLIGVRILLRYKSEWKKVDAWVRNTFKENFVNDWKSDYQHAPQQSFLAEKPKVYYKLSEYDYYGQFDANKFDKKPTTTEYNSIHYIINYNGIYVELQVRTILDEAWGECTHDVTYKGKKKDPELDVLVKCLSEQVKAAETITDLIYRKTNKEERTPKPSDVDDLHNENGDTINRKKIFYAEMVNSRINRK